MDQQTSNQIIRLQAVQDLKRKQAGATPGLFALLAEPRLAPAMQAMLFLVPNGYPVTIDVAQASIGGAGTAMHFSLPLNGHNLPLMHRRESKLLVALEGEVEVRSGARRIALLRQGQAVLLKPGTPHRVHQHGAQEVTVGVALWPGKVEQAFRDMAARVVDGRYSREEMVRILAGYDVVWHAPTEGEAVAAEVKSLEAWLTELPAELAAQIRLRWLT
jgi:mannose-6-phosphate isomerase-like protein (cupin superfamily)